MRRVTIIVTHLLGIGHLSRAITLAKALLDAGFSPQLVSGGMPAKNLDISGIDFVQLPPLRSDGANFTHLLDENGDPASQEIMRERVRMLVGSLRANGPSVLITELFPFGRRVLREEFLAALSTTREMKTLPLVLASVRDILAPPSSEKKAIQTETWLAQYYDAVLVHSDPAVAPLEASWPVTPAIAQRLHYTGFIAPAAPAMDTGGKDGIEEIIVTAGGGAVGRRLFETSLQAAALGRHRWRLLVGGNDAPEVCARLNAMANGASVLAEPLRADYRSLLTRGAAAVGQCGYNTALDWLQAGIPGVFIPFAEAGETEQSLRAGSLRDRYGYGLIDETELTAANLAAAVDAAVRRGRFRAGNINLDGAATTSAIVTQMLDARR